MRLLHILDDRQNDYASDVILGLQQAGIEQYAVIGSHSSRGVQLEEAGVKTMPFAARRPWRPSRRLWLRGLIKRLRPDITHCWTSHAARLMPQSKLPVVGWLAGYDHPRRFVRCTHFVSANRDAATRFAANSAYAGRARYIPNFAEVATVPPFDRNILATPRDAKVLLSLAPLHPASGLEFLLTVLKNAPGCIVWFKGEGSLRCELEEKARHSGVINRLRFVAPRVNRGALLRAADLCVLTARDRSCGTIIAEAWAAGTPVIASTAPGFAAPLDDGANGLLAPAGDEKALFEVINRALGDDALCRRLIAKGYASYLNTYAREAVVRQWAEFYRKIAASH